MKVYITVVIVFSYCFYYYFKLIPFYTITPFYTTFLYYYVWTELSEINYRIGRDKYYKETKINNEN